MRTRSRDSATIKLDVPLEEAQTFVAVSQILAQWGLTPRQSAWAMFLRGLRQEKARVGLYLWLRRFLGRLKREGVPDEALRQALRASVGRDSSPGSKTPDG